MLSLVRLVPRVCLVVAEMVEMFEVRLETLRDFGATGFAITGSWAMVSAGTVFGASDF